MFIISNLQVRSNLYSEHMLVADGCRTSLSVTSIFPHLLFWLTNLDRLNKFGNVQTERFVMSSPRVWQYHPFIPFRLRWIHVNPENLVPSGKQAWIFKIILSNRQIIYKWVISYIHVSLPEAKCLFSWGFPQNERRLVSHHACCGA